VLFVGAVVAGGVVLLVVDSTTIVSEKKNTDVFTNGVELSPEHRGCVDR
jgi:hypothetical protein